ncbi:codanin-1 [Mixophyes fleayi]|uniref:codanin-1 n=1 Tax=Mixophyes fleayi TaxID=3061075 RepID=UPI003F4E1224
MAAVLELLLQERATVDEVLRWVTSTTQENPVNSSLASLFLLRKDFAPFLLNFLREQTSQILSNGPSTPAKTPNSKAVSKTINTGNQRTIPEKRSSNSPGQRGSRIQLFAPSSNCSYASENSVLTSTSTSSDSPLRSNLTNCSGRTFLTSPNSSCSPSTYHSEKRSAQKSNLGNFIVFTPEVQTPRRGRKKNNSNRHVSKDLSRRSVEEDLQGENTQWSANKRKQVFNISSSPTTHQLNLNNLEEFPPMGASCESASKSKPSRRINPTPINDVHSKTRLCFTSTPISPSKIGLNHTGIDVFTSVQEGVCTPYTGSLREEREILRKERTKLLQQTSSPVVLDPITPTKQSYNRNSSSSSDMMTTCADPDKVSGRKQLEVLAELYSACITENLVPNIFLEFFFVLQLLTSRGPAGTDDKDRELESTRGVKDAVERQYFQSVHNCVFFAVLVLDFQFTVISLLDKSTLKLLAENERVGAFSPILQERLLEAHRTSIGKVSILLPSTLHSVSFQPETDNRSNFPSDRAFHIFKKQRDIFYELLREWEDYHEKADWDFERCLGNKIRAMMSNLSVASNHSHFARLFQKQLLQMCKGPSGGMGGVGDNPDQDVLNMLGSDNLNRLKRLQERFVAPQSVGGPCPPPSFPGFQEFFRDFILSAGNYQFNQHLVDSLCQEIQELDAISIVEHEATVGELDMEEQNEKIRFASILLTLRLLAKFLGFVTFLPYRATESLTGELQESAVALRNQTRPMLDVLRLLRRSIQDHRTVLTVPWAVEYLSLVDCVAPYLDYYRKVFCLLLHLYRYKLILSEEKEMGLLNKLLLLSVLGWLFQVPAVPEDMFFNSEAVREVLSVSAVVATQALDCVPLVDQQLLYSCCPYIGELRKLLISFVAGCGAKNGGFLRKITPTAAEPLMPKPTLSQKKLQAELEQAFFHNQPPSLRRTVEFVAERIGSNCVKHIKATLVADLVRRAEVVLQDKVTQDSASHRKLLDSVCVKLCEDGRQALQEAQEYCKKAAPEAVRVLLPEEISSCVLSSAEDIAVSLATEKASTWLNSNISALIKREVTATFTRMVKSQSVVSSVNCEDVRKGCRKGCEHKVTLPSRLITEIKDVLSIAVGPRDEEEGVQSIQLKRFLERLSETLNCRNYITPSAEHHLAKCTVELASLLVSDRVPLLDFTTVHEEQIRKREEIRHLLTTLLVVWEKDFRVPVPVQLMFSHKNIAYITDVRTHEWELFAFILRRLVGMGLIRHKEIEDHICRLQEYNWTSNLLVDLERLVLGSETLREADELQDPACILVPQTATGIIVPS